MAKRKAKSVSPIDYRHKAIVPIRDMERDGRIAFEVIVYGVEPTDLCIVPGGGTPAFRAVERIGLDTNRYQATIWDLQV